MELFQGRKLLYGHGEIALPNDWAESPFIVPQCPISNFVLKDNLEELLENPIASRPITELLSPEEDVVIVVSDSGHSDVTATILRSLLSRIPSGCGVRILIALGLHRKRTREEIENLIGREVAAKYPVFQSDAHRRNSFLFMGRTRYGTEVELSKYLLAESAYKEGTKVSNRQTRVILTGEIAPHYFFGFTGGRKSILPGCASAKTVRENHFLFLCDDGSRHPACRAGNLDGNPCSEDALDAAAMVSPVFLVNTVVGAGGEPVGLVCGHWQKAHEEGCLYLLKRCAVHLSCQSDVVVASCGGFAKDANFIQAHKAMAHSFRAVKPGGTLVLVAECAEGFGHSTFFRWFKYKDIGEFAAVLRRRYQVYGQTAYSTLWKARQVDILLLSKLKPEEVREMSITPVSSLDDAFARVKAKYGKDYSLTIIPFAPDTLIL